MTTTTADKGELLPLPDPALQAGYNAYMEQRFFHSAGMADALGYKHSQKAYYTADQMREYAIANRNLRPTNEGQDGLTDSEILTDAHRYCCKYVHADDAPYRFTERGIIEFVRLRVERALNQRQAVKAEPAIEALAMIGEVLGLDEDDAGPTPIIEKIVCLQEAFETVKRLHLIATNQVVDLRKAAKPEPLSAAQGVPEGWKLVPIEPTAEMKEAWLKECCNQYDWMYWDKGYKAMLSAAPEQAEGEEATK